VEILNDYFVTVFTTENITCIPTPISNNRVTDTSNICNINITESDVSGCISKLNINKAHGPDDIYARTIKELNTNLCEPLRILFQKSIDTCDVPNDWKSANVSPIFKQGNKIKAENYRPISLTSLIGKLLETIIRNKIVEFLDEHNLLRDSQHGFRIKRSCLTNLLDFYDTLIKQYEEDKAVDVIFLDLQKAFDKVPHERLLVKLYALGIRGNAHKWIKNWLTGRIQRVNIKGIKSDWKPVTSGVPQGSVLGPILFLCYINDIDEGIDGYITKFADDTKLMNPASTTKDTSILQKDLNKISNWAEKWQMKFNANKCKVMHIGCKNILNDYTMDAVNLKSVERESDLGVIIDKSLKVSHQCTAVVKKANKILGLISRSFEVKNKNNIITLYKSLVRPHLEYCSQVWSPHLRKDVVKIEKVQRRATKLIPSLRNLPYEDRLKKLNLTTLEQRRIRMDMMEIYKILHSIDKLDYHKYISISNNITRGNGIKLRKKTVNSDISKYWYFNRIVNTWNALPEDVVSSPSISIFKCKLDKHMQVTNI
jgi:hypothetical protein